MTQQCNYLLTLETFFLSEIFYILFEVGAHTTVKLETARSWEYLDIAKNPVFPIN